jgi:hypothetical protein
VTNKAARKSGFIAIARIRPIRPPRLLQQNVAKSNAFTLMLIACLHDCILAGVSNTVFARDFYARPTARPLHFRCPAARTLDFA